MSTMEEIQSSYAIMMTLYQPAKHLYENAMEKLFLLHALVANSRRKSSCEKVHLTAASQYSTNSGVTSHLGLPPTGRPSSPISKRVLRAGRMMSSSQRVISTDRSVTSELKVWVKGRTSAKIRSRNVTTV